MKLRTLFTVAGITTACAALLGARPAYPENVVKDPTPAPAQARDNQPASPLDFTVTNIDGKSESLAKYKGSVVMIVNVASRCGYTPQYKQLEAIYKKYADRGFVILGFPANNFNGQEPGSNDEIKTFCSSKYDVTFPLMAKISVLGADKAPIYKFLTEEPTAGPFAGDIGWNFNKFIVDRNGNVIARYNSKVKPDDAMITKEIEKALAAKGSAAAAAAR